MMLDLIVFALVLVAAQLVASIVLLAVMFEFMASKHCANKIKKTMTNAIEIFADDTEEEEES